MLDAEKTTTMRQAHDNWATFYDFVYEKTFGSFYSNLTTQTLLTINDILDRGSIIDFGAGTGRLSFPLTEQGYSVVAVEKSNGMAEEFKRKAFDNNLDVEIQNCSISDFRKEKVDLAIALFTVLSYSITEEELSKNIKNICQHINLRGYFFFDLPNAVFFNGGRLINIQLENFKRVVELVDNGQNDIYTYKENCSGIFNKQKFSYEDEFRIRYWKPCTLDTLLHENGYKDTLKVFPQFNSTGSTYKLYQNQ